MLALQEWRDTLCPLCGLPREVCTDPSAEFKWHAEPIRCHVHTATLRAQEEARGKYQLPGGQLWRALQRGVEPEPTEG